MDGTQSEPGPLPRLPAIAAVPAGETTCERPEILLDVSGGLQERGRPAPRRLQHLLSAACTAGPPAMSGYTAPPDPGMHCDVSAAATAEADMACCDGMGRVGIDAARTRGRGMVNVIHIHVGGHSNHSDSQQPAHPRQGPSCRGRLLPTDRSLAHSLSTAVLHKCLCSLAPHKHLCIHPWLSLHLEADASDAARVS